MTNSFLVWVRYYQLLVITTNTNGGAKQEINNRETIAALNYEIHQMSFIPAFFYATQILMISANDDKGERLRANNKSL